jgi:uncharacterized protein YndB with AHSA1/START domain
MAARDGSVSFDFEGVYSNVEQHKLIEYAMEDGRKVMIIFSARDNETEVVETFDPEGTNPLDMQREGWQSILNNFKQYTEANA